MIRLKFLSLPAIAWGFAARELKRAQNGSIGLAPLLSMGAVVAGGLTPLAGARQVVFTHDPASTTAALFSDALVACCAGGCGPIAGPTVMLEPGLDGADITWFTESLCKVHAFSGCSCKARAWARVDVDGLGSSSIRIHAEAYSYVKHKCCDLPCAYDTRARGEIGDLASGTPFTLGLTIDDISPGSSTGFLPVFHRGDGFSFNSFSPEAGGDDVVYVTATSVLVAGMPGIAPGALDLFLVRGALSDDWADSFPGSFPSSITVVMTGATGARIRNPGIVTSGPYGMCERDQEYAGVVYDFELSLGAPPPPPPPPGGPPVPPVLEFSVDIGSDTERSDPTPDGNEAFEPFDTYLGMTLGPPLSGDGEDGFRTDDAAFGLDITPEVPLGPPAPGVCTTPPPPGPCMSGFPISLATLSSLDLDGTDSIDFSLAALTDAGALSAPIPASESLCVHRADHLLISLDDDSLSHFVGGSFFVPGFGIACDPCPVPVGSVYGFTLATHGSAALDDEVMGLDLVATPDGMTEGLLYPIADEAGVHVNLAPNPPFPPFAPVSQAADDDIDGLDAHTPIDIGGPCVDCDIWLFGVDHEARAAFEADDPTNIYQWTPGGGPPVLAVGGTAHLGLPAGTDLRDFELVRLPDPSGAPGEVFAILFTVSPDDPLTAGVDESGSLNPGMVYGSYLDGTNFAMMADALEDAIDALAAWPAPVTTLFPLPPIDPCPPDINGDGVVNVEDLLLVIASWSSVGGPADINCDGIVNVGDLLAVIAAWGPCP